MAIAPNHAVPEAVIRPVEQAEWVTLTSRFRDHNYRQTWGFGVACARRVGATSEHVAIESQGALLALADVRVKVVPFLGGVAYITGGPLVRLDSDLNTNGRRLHAALSALRQHYVRKRGLTLRVRPTVGDPDWSSLQTRAFHDGGFRVSTHVAPYRTMVVDLRPDLQAIRKGLAQKWRNCLNASEREGLTVVVGDDAEYLAHFARLYDDLADRKQFHSDLNCDFYRNVQPTLNVGERFLVTLVLADGIPAAGHVGHIAGDTCVYVLGASNDLGRQRKASYLAQWAFIEHAKRAGCAYYDLGGVDELGNPGVYHFKQGIGGREVRAPGPFEAPTEGLRRILLEFADHSLQQKRRIQSCLSGVLPKR